MSRSQAQSRGGPTLAGTVTVLKGSHGFIQSDAGDQYFLLPSVCHDWNGELPREGTRVNFTAETEAAWGKNPKALHVWHERGDASTHPNKQQGGYAEKWQSEKRKHEGNWNGRDDRWSSYAKSKWGSYDGAGFHETIHEGAKFTGTMASDLGNYGFINQDTDDGEECRVFVLPYSCPDGMLPLEESRVEFTIVRDPKTNKPRAEDVVFEGQGDPEQPVTDEFVEEADACPEDLVFERGDDPKAAESAEDSGPALGEVCTGIISKARRNFGFVMPDEGSGGNMFILPSQCIGFNSFVPPVGTRVQFTVGWSRQHEKKMATDVVPLDDHEDNEVFKGVVATNYGNYGFIKDEEGEQIFVLPAYCSGWGIFDVGTSVVFRKVESKKTGKPMAQDVEVDPDPPVRPIPPTRPPESMQDVEGVLVSHKGQFGFVRTKDEEEFFIHHSDCPGEWLPAVGTRLRFDKCLGGKRPACKNVSILAERSKPSKTETSREDKERVKSPPPKTINTPPPAPPLPRRPRTFKSEETAKLWQRYCEEYGHGVCDPEEHPAAFLRQFIRAVLPDDVAEPASKRQRT